MSKNVLIKLTQSHHIHCLKICMMGCVDDVELLENNSLKFIIKCESEYKEVVEEIMSSIKSIASPKLNYEVISSDHDVDYWIEIPVTSIVLPFALSLEVPEFIEMNPKLFRESMESMELTCCPKREVWVFNQDHVSDGHEMTALLHHCFTNVLKLLEMSEKVIRDIEQVTQ